MIHSFFMHSDEFWLDDPGFVTGPPDLFTATWGWAEITSLSLFKFCDKYRSRLELKIVTNSKFFQEANCLWRVVHLRCFLGGRPAMSQRWLVTEWRGHYNQFPFWEFDNDIFDLWEREFGKNSSRSVAWNSTFNFSRITNVIYLKQWP